MKSMNFQGTVLFVVMSVLLGANLFSNVIG